MSATERFEAGEYLVMLNVTVNRKDGNGSRPAYAQKVLTLPEGATRYVALVHMRTLIDTDSARIHGDIYESAMYASVNFFYCEKNILIPPVERDLSREVDHFGMPI